MTDPEGNESRPAAAPAHSGDDATIIGRPDHELEELEDDQNVPPRPEELIADAARADRAPTSD